MDMEFFCELKISECWREKKEIIINKLKKGRIQPMVYLVTLAQGDQNQLEFFSSILLKQHIFDNAHLFVVGIADGYDGAVEMIRDITEEIYERTGNADLRNFILNRQKEYIKAGQ